MNQRVIIGLHSFRSPIVDEVDRPDRGSPPVAARKQAERVTRLATKMNILGLNAYHGDVSAVLVRDGELVSAVEEERFRRVKHCAGFPRESIRTCLEQGGISPAEIDRFAVSRNPRAHLLRKLVYTIRHRPGSGLIWDRLRNRGRVSGLPDELAVSLGLASSDVRERLHWVEHHPAHLASAFFVSPFEEAAVCAIDGFGDFVSTSLAIGRGSRLRLIDRVCFPHSLGMLYLAITQFLGFHRYGDEFKVMGLAPYGEPDYSPQLRRLLRLETGGRFELDPAFFRHGSEGVSMSWDDGEPEIGTVYTDELVELLGPPRDPDEPLERKCANPSWKLKRLQTLWFDDVEQTTSSRKRKEPRWEVCYVRSRNARSHVVWVRSRS